MAIRKNHIDFKNIEKLVLAEAQRKENLWERKSKKLLVVLIIFFLILLYFQRS